MINAIKIVLFCEKLIHSEEHCPKHDVCQWMQALWYLQVTAHAQSSKKARANAITRPENITHLKDRLVLDSFVWLYLMKNILILWIKKLRNICIDLTPFIDIYVIYNSKIWFYLDCKYVCKLEAKCGDAFRKCINLSKPDRRWYQSKIVQIPGNSRQIKLNM